MKNPISCWREKSEERKRELRNIALIAYATTLGGFGAIVGFHQLFLQKLPEPDDIIFGFGTSLVSGTVIFLISMFLTKQGEKRIMEKLDSMDKKLDKLDVIEKKLDKLDTIDKKLDKLDDILIAIKELTRVIKHDKGYFQTSG